MGIIKKMEPEVYQEDGDGGQQVLSETTRYKQLDITTAPMRTVKQWYRLPRQAVQSPALEDFKHWSELKTNPALSKMLD